MAITALDIVRHNAGDSLVGIIEESMAAHPELTLGSARTIEGTHFESLVRVTLPAVGFRNLNEGVAATKSEWALRRSQCFLVDASAEVDKAAGDQLEDGLDAFLATQIGDHLEAAMRSVCSQAYYGVTNTVGAASTAASAAKGFPGLVDTYDATNMAVDGGGGGAARTSVWLVKYGPKYVQWLFGRSGEIAAGETTEVRLTDGSGNPYDGLRKPVTFWMGLYNPNPRNSAVRIRNVTVASPLTDALIYDALELFPVGIQPDVILMTRRSYYQLRDSRTATNPTGAPAPLPDSIRGPEGDIPIRLTDAISNAETA